MNDITQLEAAEAILREFGRPMSSRELAIHMKSMDAVKIEGQTPWKTVNARLSEDIRSLGPSSKFLRTGHGQFGLREWEDATEFVGFQRKINPVDEVILVVAQQVLATHETRTNKFGLFEVDIRNLLRDTEEMVRLEAEQTTDVVQLVPTFLIRRDANLLCYTRTKRLPEARLHNQRSLSCGGHMQSDDVPELFFFDDDILSRFLCRELYEELELSPAPKHIRFLGMLHLDGNDFELQHAGLIFDVLLDSDATYTSLEPGMHTDIAFEDIKKLSEIREQHDSWSQVFLNILGSGDL